MVGYLTCVPVRDVLSQGILSSSTTCGISGCSVEALHVIAIWWQFLTLLIKQGKFFSFFTLRLCRRDLRIPVCLLTGYNILN